MPKTARRSCSAIQKRLCAVSLFFYRKNTRGYTGTIPALKNSLFKHAQVGTPLDFSSLSSWDLHDRGIANFDKLALRIDHGCSFPLLFPFEKEEACKSIPVPIPSSGIIFLWLTALPILFTGFFQKSCSANPF
jgi:hypothetical protein